LIGRIALPGLMHGGGATVDGQGSSAGQGGAEIDLDEPALEGPGGGQCGYGEMLGEDDANEFGAPVGMLATESLGLKKDGILGEASGGWIGATVGGGGHDTVVAAGPQEQVLDSAKGQAEAPDEGFTIESFLLVGLPNGPPDPLAYRARHDVPSSFPWLVWGFSLCYPAQNLMSGFSAKRHVRQHLPSALRTSATTRRSRNALPRLLIRPCLALPARCRQTSVSATYCFASRS
jgi:hypothetical protein